MLTFTQEATDYAIQNGGTLHLEYFQLGGCCIPYQPEPTVRLGVPPGPQGFDVRTIDGIVVYIPHSLPAVPLEIRLSTFFGFKWLVVAGWRHC